MFDRKEHNKQYQKQYYQEHKEYYNEKSKQWYLAHKEEIKEKNKQYYIDHKKEMKKYFKQHRIDHSEERKEYNTQWNLNHLEQRKKYCKKYRKTPEGKAAIQRGNIKRRERERNIVNTLTAKEWEDILEQYDYRCAYCGVEFNCELFPHKDHVIPISKGGDNVKENVVPSCQSCNSKKSNKILT